MDLGWGEILVIVVLALLVYGGELPTVARSIGRSIGAIRKGLSDSTSDVKQALDLDVDVGDVGERAADDTRRRTVRRFPADQPAPPDVAQEDISGPGAVASGDGAGVTPPGAAEPPREKPATGA